MGDRSKKEKRKQKTGGVEDKGWVSGIRRGKKNTSDKRRRQGLAGVREEKRGTEERRSGSLEGAVGGKSLGGGWTKEGLLDREEIVVGGKSVGGTEWGEASGTYLARLLSKRKSHLT